MNTTCSKLKAEHLEHKIDDELDNIVEAASEIGLRKDELISRLMEHWQAHQTDNGSNHKADEIKKSFEPSAGP